MLPCSALYTRLRRGATRLCYNERMDKRRALRNEFLRVYFGIRLTPLGRPPSHVLDEVRQLKTLVVDTPHLTSGYQTFESYWLLEGASGSPEEIAYRATTQSHHLLMRGLNESLSHRHSKPTEPASRGDGKVAWTSWYHGETFEIDLAGSIEEVLVYCDVTENEREQVMMTARSLAHGGHLVYATAHGSSNEPAPTHGNLSFCGLVVTTLHLSSGTLQALTELRNHGIQVVYMTDEPEDLATHVADIAHLTSHPKIARHGTYVTSTEHAVYARIDRINARRVIAQLPSPVLIARHPVAELARMIMTCR